MKTLVKIIRRSEQGKTQPFVCVALDGAGQRVQCYLKGRSTTRVGQINEWIAAHLALAFGLPAPPFALLDVPTELIEADFEQQDFANGLGAGPAFASQHVDSDDIAFSDLPRIPASLQRDVLVFDAWVRNMDRSLSEHGGNPNLRWCKQAHDFAPAQLLVIDHNLAFDAEFTADSFAACHAFAGQIPALKQDFALQLHYRDRMAAALACCRSASRKFP